MVFTNSVPIFWGGLKKGSFAKKQKIDIYIYIYNKNSGFSFFWQPPEMAEICQDLNQKLVQA